jgi:hypothetical protein
MLVISRMSRRVIEGEAEAEAEALATAANCIWCARAFKPRRGGSPQRFCSPRHRTAFHSAARRWAEANIATGTLPVGAIKDGVPAAYTLHPGNGLPSSAPEAVERRDDSAKLLNRVVATLPAHVFAMLPRELLDAIFDYFPAGDV